jgi:hypothetical protein
LKLPLEQQQQPAAAAERQPSKQFAVTTAFQSALAAAVQDL